MFTLVPTRLTHKFITQVVDPPVHGALFTSDAFQALFATWFPPGCEFEGGPWLATRPLLTSDGERLVSPLAGEAAAAAATAGGAAEGEQLLEM